MYATNLSVFYKPTLKNPLTKEIENTAGVAPLVVVPGDKLDEGAAQSNTGLSIEDGGVVVTVQIGRDELVLGVSQDACNC